MQSKGKRQPNSREREHMERVRRLPCSVNDEPGPSELHEIKQGQWWTVIALCPDCHRGSLNGLHGQRRMWKLKKMDELGALAVTIERLNSEAYA
jgi:hypothetical protein